MKATTKKTSVKPVAKMKSGGAKKTTSKKMSLGGAPNLITFDGNKKRRKKEGRFKGDPSCKNAPNHG
jgi:hypothetical protein